MPPGLADTFLEAVPDALGGILRRYARTHGPFTNSDAARRYGLSPLEADSRFRALHAEGKLLEGEFRPDPANPYGSILPWTEARAEHNMSRAAGASVILINGRLAAFLRRRNSALRVMLPDDEPERGQAARALAQKLAEVAIRRGGVLLDSINDTPAASHFLKRFLEEAGFVQTVTGFHMRRLTAITMPEDEVQDEELAEDG